ncbi:MAG: CarD family transcriptional regulator [Armatimonadota bacterium]
MEIGDVVLHPKYGVGVIHSIEKRLMDGVMHDFFVIPKPSISSTIFIPVDAANEVGLRPLSTVDKLKQALSILTGETEVANQLNETSTLNWSDPVDLACAIRSDTIKTKSGHVKASWQTQLKHAKGLLFEELSAVFGMSEESIAALINKEA